jgi:HEAT repeat protein
MTEARPTGISESGHGVLAAAVLGVGATVARADSAAVDKLVSELQSQDEAVRGAAWQGAATLGAPAVKPLATLMAHGDFEIARSAKRALWRIVRLAGRPNADKKRKAVQAELVALLDSAPLSVRREAVWMLSEIGDSSTVEDIAKLLSEAEAREDARGALERIPGPQATRVLQQAMQTAPEDFRFALANSLRVRGREIKGYPSQKLLASRQTSVKPK